MTTHPTRKPSKPRGPRPSPTSALAAPFEEQAFAEVVEMIQAARGQAVVAVNKILIDLYWRVGEYISRKIETAAWGEGVVDFHRGLNCLCAIELKVGRFEPEHLGKLNFCHLTPPAGPARGLLPSSQP
jgi:hypothetical protein